MMPTGLFSQIALIILSVGIIFTYIKPALGEIGTTQDTIVVYQTERQKVSDVNQKLDQVTSSVNTVSSEDKLRLVTYIPDQVDTVAVPRDLKAITDSVGAILLQVEYEGPETATAAPSFVDPSLLPSAPAFSSLEPEAHVFNFEFEASYEQVKSVLQAIEKNAYPLEVHDLTIQNAKGGFLSVTMKVVTYDRLPPPVPVLDQFGQVTS
jgi:hypothetical protein